MGTVTEIHDYLRLLFARAGTPYCPEHNLKMHLAESFEAACVRFCMLSGVLAYNGCATGAAQSHLSTRVFPSVSRFDEWNENAGVQPGCGVAVQAIIELNGTTQRQNDFPDDHQSKARARLGVAGHKWLKQPLSQSVVNACTGVPDRQQGHFCLWLDDDGQGAVRRRMVDGVVQQIAG